MIDTHQHYWQIDRGGYSWIDRDNPILYRDHQPQDLKPIINQHNIKATIAVQADDNEAETQYLLSLAEQCDFLIGVVGWVDLEDPNVVSRIHDLAKNRYFLGIRPMIQEIAKIDWMLKPELSQGLQQLIQLDLTFDALIEQKHLPYLIRFLQKYPDLRVVIDHFAKPKISKQSFKEWADNIHQVANNKHTYCKLSGLLTEANEGVTDEELLPYVEHVWNVFGDRRLLFGSDWPVVNLNGGYTAWVDFLQRFFASHLDTLYQQIGINNVKQAYPKINTLLTSTK